MSSLYLDGRKVWRRWRRLRMFTVWLVNSIYAFILLGVQLLLNERFFTIPRGESQPSYGPAKNRLPFS